MALNAFKNHLTTYKNCPIYWQFSSGKENGFNCLVYMHRYEPSLVARIRTDYLHKTQKAIEQAIANCDNIINHSTSNTEISCNVLLDAFLIVLITSLTSILLSKINAISF